MTVIAYAGDTQIAKSENTVLVEGNHYFPKDDVDMTALSATDMHTTCHWKGEASYYNISAGGQMFENAAFHYPEPSEAAKSIEGKIAFWQGIRVVEE